MFLGLPLLSRESMRFRERERDCVSIFFKFSLGVTTNHGIVVLEFLINFISLFYLFPMALYRLCLLFSKK